MTAESDGNELAHGPPTMPDMYVHPIHDGDSGLAKVHLVVANPSDTEYLIIRKGQPYARLTQVTPYSDDQVSDQDIATASFVWYSYLKCLPKRQRWNPMNT